MKRHSAVCHYVCAGGDWGRLGGGIRGFGSGLEEMLFAGLTEGRRDPSSSLGDCP
jgi:hypothetical protein